MTKAARKPSERVLVELVNSHGHQCLAIDGVVICGSWLGSGTVIKSWYISREELAKLLKEASA